MKELAEYAVYKKDELLFIGTAKEAAEYFNVKEKTVYFWTTPSHHKRVKYGMNNRRKKECGRSKVCNKN